MGFLANHISAIVLSNDPAKKKVQLVLYFHQSAHFPRSPHPPAQTYSTLNHAHTRNSHLAQAMLPELAMRMPALLILLLLGTVGCTATPRQSIDAFNHRHGGTLEGPPAQRARAVGQRLLDAHPHWAHVRIFVLDTPSVAAYSWPNAEIYLTRGLLDKCTDRQLTAIIAHELGHLVNDAASPSAVQGDRLAIEKNADRIGAELLHAAGFDPSAMPSALEVVCAAQTNPTITSHLRHRIATLHAHTCPSP